MSEKFPAIPHPVATLEGLRRSMLALKEGYEILAGQRGEGSIRAYNSAEALAALETLRAEAEAYADAGDRWALIASAAITAVGDIALTWTGGVYPVVKVLMIGVRPASATANGMFCRIRRNGSVLSGGTDYNRVHLNYDGTTGSAAAGAASIHELSFNGQNSEANHVEIDLSHWDTSERPLISSRTGYTSNTPSHSMLWGKSNVSAGSGWLDGLTVGIVGGSPTFQATGRIIAMGLKP